MKKLVLLSILLVTSCGGTFTLRPDGTLSYRTPELIRPKVIQPVK